MDRSGNLGLEKDKKSLKHFIASHFTIIIHRMAERQTYYKLLGSKNKE